ncbi:phosphatase PAP2 family protein [Mucisphaera sp.]|uniref:phosphatase PAP2 family protein n=1 Tax=Mucisphaera sp. TaxID=2913024 RepID=UPI003D0FB583
MGEGGLSSWRVAARDWWRWLGARPVGLEGAVGSWRWWGVFVGVGMLVVVLDLLADRWAVEAVHGWPRTWRVAASWLTEWGGSRAWFYAGGLWLIGLGLVKGLKLGRVGLLLVPVLMGLGLGSLAWVYADEGIRDRASWVIGGVVLVGLGLAQADQRWVRGVVLVVVCVAVSGIVVNVVKPMVGQSRPNLYFSEGVDERRPLTFGYDYGSFPSGHATTAGAVAGSIALVCPAARVPMVVFAVATGSTRVGTLSHYPSDVVAGLWLGWVSAGALRGLARRGVSSKH